LKDRILFPPDRFKRWEYVDSARRQMTEDRLVKD